MQSLSNFENKINSFKVLNAFDLKIIAIVTMLLDHIARIFFPDLFFLKWIGRIAFVLFCFLLVEGAKHSKNRNKYILRLAIWALLSELPYDFAFTGSWLNWGRQNVLFTLLFGLIAIQAIESKMHLFFKTLAITAIALLATYCMFDYQYLGILQIVFFYIFRNGLIKKFISVGILNATFLGKISSQVFAILAFVPIALYNGTQGRKAGRLLYAVYAAHLLLFGIIKHH